MSSFRWYLSITCQKDGDKLELRPWESTGAMTLGPCLTLPSRRIVELPVMQIFVTSLCHSQEPAIAGMGAVGLYRVNYT